MNCRAERTTQTLEYMLRDCINDFKGNLDEHLPWIEFSYNNSFHSSISTAPFEAFMVGGLDLLLDSWRFAIFRFFVLI